MSISVNTTKIVNIGGYSGCNCGFMPYSCFTPGCFDFGFNSYMPMYPCGPMMYSSIPFIGTMCSFIGFNLGEKLGNLIPSLIKS